MPHRVESLNYMTAYSMGLSVFHLTQLFSKARKDVQDDRLCTMPLSLSFNVFFLEKLSEYRHKPYRLVEETSVPAQDLRS